MSTQYSMGQMNQLGDAFEAAGYTPGDVTKLQQFGDLALIKAVLNGTAEIKIVKHIIDCDGAPFVPGGWEVEEHIKDGQVEWNPADIELYLDLNQKNGKSNVGNKLRKLLASKKKMNASILDFLLAHPELIPEEWKGKAIFFWGTIYRNSGGDLYVRCLYWDGGRWGWYCYWLGDGFFGNDPAALRK